MVAEKGEEHIRELKRLLDAAERRTSEEKAQRAEEKRLYEEEIVRVREEGNQRVEEVSRMAKEITQQLKEEARRQTEERRVHNKEVERVKKEGNRQDEILKRAEEAIAAALAGKEEAERRSSNLMEKVEERIRKAVEEATMRVERLRQWEIIQNSDQVIDLDADVESVQDLVQIPTAGPSNRGMDGGMNQGQTSIPFYVAQSEKEEDMGMSSQDEEEVNGKGKGKGKRKDKKVGDFSTFHNFFFD